MESDHLTQGKKGCFGIKLENKELQEALTKHFRDHGRKSVTSFSKGRWNIYHPSLPSNFRRCVMTQSINLSVVMVSNGVIMALPNGARMSPFKPFNFGLRPRICLSWIFFCSVFSTV